MTRAATQGELAFAPARALHAAFVPLGNLGGGEVPVINRALRLKVIHAQVH